MIFSGSMRHIGWGLSVWMLFASITSAQDIRYRVRIKGAPNSEVRDDLRSVSDMQNLIKRPPATERQLRRRAERDIPRFLQILRAHGYYEAAVDLSLRTDRTPVRVSFQVEPGPPYTLRTISIDAVGTLLSPAPKSVGLEPGTQMKAQAVLDAQERIVLYFRRQGYPFAKVTDREVRVEREARAVDVFYKVDAGPQAYFGPVDFVGLITVDESFVRRKIDWQEGDPFNADRLRTFRQRLAGSGLFASVRLTHADKLSADERLPINVELSERKPRSVSLGAGYRSDEGARVQTRWEHRNWSGEGEQLLFSLMISEIGHTVEARVHKPDLGWLDQSATLVITTGREDTDAYLTQKTGVLLSLDKIMRPGWAVGTGVGYTYSDVREKEHDEFHSLLYFPLYSGWDRSNDLLDPRRGWRLNLGLAPYFDLRQADLGFIKTRAALTQYKTLSRRTGLDWAGRVTLGSILGESRNGVPADERWYAGGGGTVRGYEYQSVGPLDDKTPRGGKSLLVVSTEARWRINDEFGLVAFVDGGTAFASSAFDSGEPLRWGTGVGIRYFTPVGPLRFDLAFPLNRRSGMDDAYQFYISLGQAF